MFSTRVISGKADRECRGSDRRPAVRGNQTDRLRVCREGTVEKTVSCSPTPQVLQYMTRLYNDTCRYSHCCYGLRTLFLEPLSKLITRLDFDWSVSAFFPKCSPGSSRSCPPRSARSGSARCSSTGGWWRRSTNRSSRRPSSWRRSGEPPYCPPSRAFYPVPTLGTFPRKTCGI